MPLPYTITTLRALTGCVLLTAFSGCLGFVRYQDTTPEDFSETVTVRDENYLTVYISAQLPVNEQGELVGPGDLERQTAQVFLNIQERIKARRGNLDNLVSVTCYLTDIDQMDAFYRGRDRLINEVDPPTFTIVPVERLPREGALVMIRAVAVVPLVI